MRSIIAILLILLFQTFGHAEKGSVKVDPDASQDSKVMARHIQEGAHDALCVLVTVVGGEDVWSRDLYIRAVSDMGAGVLTQSQPVYGSNMTSLVVGANPVFQLRESNRFWFDSNLTKAIHGLDAFSARAKAKGYTVKNLGGIHCQSSSRHVDREARVREAQRLRDISRKAAAKAKALEMKTEEPKAEEPKAPKAPKKTDTEEGKTSPA